MAVLKKKVVSDPEESGTIDLSANLARVREAIQNLPDKEPEMATATETSAAPKNTSKKPAKATASATDEVRLADLCKTLKVKPAAARRKLRAAGVEVDSQRWSWKAGSAALKKVTDLLSAKTS